jgi:hypothetical protein
MFAAGCKVGQSLFDGAQVLTALDQPMHRKSRRKLGSRQSQIPFRRSTNLPRKRRAVVSKTAQDIFSMSFQ